MVFCLAWNSVSAAIPIPLGSKNAEILLAAASGSHKELSKDPAETPYQAMREEMRKRGAELENFVYEVFDPNAKDPLADLGKMEMHGSGRRAKILWIAAGAVVLAGAGAAGYLWYSEKTADKVINLPYSDK